MRWLWVTVLVAAAGCNSLSTISPQTYERMMLPLMTSVQRADYYKRPTWPERKAYLYEIELIQKFDASPTTVRSAILAQRVIKGMNPDQVTMSWGAPVRRLILQPSQEPEVAQREGRQERWLYSPVITADLSVRYRRAVEFTNGVVLYVRDERSGSR